LRAPVIEVFFQYCPTQMLALPAREVGILNR